MTLTKEVVFQPEGKHAEVEIGSNILESAKLAGVDLTSVCGGKGKCGKCKIIIKDSERVSPITDVEKEILTSEELSTDYRLACRALIRDSLTVRIPEESRTGKQRLQVEGIKTPVELGPLIGKYYVRLPKPTLKDPRSDLDRLMKELQEKHGIEGAMIEYDVVKDLALVLRDANWEVTVTVWNGKEIIDIEPGDTTKRCFGYAVDIGTTKLAGYLINLNTGRVEAVDSLMNPQIPYGEDVITRIAYEDHEELQHAIVGGINKILNDLCEKVGVNLREVYEMTAVGNTAMHHLFLNINPKHVALSPYTPVIREGVDVKAGKIGVKINPNGNIYALPVIAGFVGADNVAVILATEIYKRDELCLALDIGTNTEVVLGNKDWMLACSCASGPAFEGAHITHGMRAASGAIEKVSIDSETLEAKYKTIDNAKPRGICGSAIVDIPAELLKTGIIDINGTLGKDLDSPRLRKKEGVQEFVIARKEETTTGGDIVITQKDIREIQLAKAAMHTGATTLMKEAKVTEEDIDVVFIAGAFGSYIDPENARIIGMYPEISLKKVRIVGNAAGTGARMALASKAARKTAEKISKEIRYVELGNDPNFQSELMNSYFLPYADLSRYPRTSRLLKKMGHYPEKKPPIM
ncbi:MAG: ASKHA domain-containing protein [Candidatus Hodarchaeota archaeon]